jgi:pimeloyl-ACP methyl ester carboxylesterase
MKIGAPSRQLFAYTGGRPLDAARPCVVFIHGAQHDHSVWILQSRYLAHHGCSVLAIDLPGHGRSDGPALESVEAMADRLAEALREVRCGRLVLAGHSMGSLVALETQLRLGPDRVAGMALLGTAFPMRVSDELLDATRNDAARAMQMINVWSHRASIAPFQVRPGNPGPGFCIVWENWRLMQRIERLNGAHVLPTDFAACNAYAGGLDAMRAASCPVLFLLGRADAMTVPRLAQGLIDACARPQVVHLPATGHAMMAENPEGVRRALAEFVRGVTAPADSP